MGQPSSKEEQQEREIDYITAYLHHHRDIVYSLAHAVNAHQAHVESMLITKSKDTTKLPIGDIDTKQENTNEEDDTSQQAVDISTTVHDRTKRLLGSIQDSLQCQCSALQTSFLALNSCIHRALDNFRENTDCYSGSSVDKVYPKKWISYTNSPEPPKTDIKKILEIEAKKVSNLQQNLNEKECTIEQLQKERQNLENIIEKYENERIKMDRSVELNKKEITKLQNLNKDLQIKMLDKEKSIQVQLFYQSRGDVMVKVIDGLKAVLAENLQTDRKKIQFIDCVSEQDVDPDIPLFLMCVNASRIGSDVGTAVQKLKQYVSSNVCVLVIHHKDVHALPYQLSDRVLSGPEFRELGGIFDIAFLAEKGIYACDMNTASANGIIKFLNTRYVRDRFENIQSDSST